MSANSRTPPSHPSRRELTAEDLRYEFQSAGFVCGDLDLEFHHFGRNRILIFRKAIQKHVIKRGRTGAYLAVNLHDQGLGGAGSQEERDARFERRERTFWNSKTALPAEHAQQVEPFSRG